MHSDPTSSTPLKPHISDVLVLGELESSCKNYDSAKHAIENGQKSEKSLTFLAWRSKSVDRVVILLDRFSWSELSIPLASSSTGVAARWPSAPMAVTVEVKVKEGRAYPAKPVARIADLERIWKMYKLLVMDVVLTYSSHYLGLSKGTN